MKKSLIIKIIIISLIVILPLAWYLLSPIFIDKTVNETITAENIIYQGEFQGADSFHKVNGKAIILSDENSSYLRLENFQSTNGPDLKVYLSENLSDDSYISLGELKGNIGSQNYVLSSDIDLKKYKNVLIWCERFSVLFGSAELKS